MTTPAHFFPDDFVFGVATAASSTSEGAADTQKAASQLTRMAADLQGLVGRFRV